MPGFRHRYQPYGEFARVSPDGAAVPTPTVSVLLLYLKREVEKLMEVAMSRRYTSEDKERILHLLIANNGDIDITCQQTGVPPRTLYRWQKTANILPLPLSPLPPPTRIADDDITALRDLQQQMLREAYHLVHSIEEAIDEAPLSQRVAALAQLIDRIIKLSAQLPRTNNDDMKIAYDEGYERDDPFETTSPESETHSPQ